MKFRQWLNRLRHRLIPSADRWDRDFARCELCRYWLTYGYGGECKRRAPTTRPGSSGGYFPSTGSGDWCGEYERKQP
jgi:hypothetical protein